MLDDGTVPVARLRALYDAQVRPAVGARLTIAWSPTEEHRTLRARTGSGVRVHTDGLSDRTEDATSGQAARSRQQVAQTALRHLDRRDPGPSVIDGRSNCVAGGATRLVGRHAGVQPIQRPTDPSRRAT